MENFNEVWRPANRQPKEGQRVIVQCCYVNGTIGYKECTFIGNQFIYFRTNGEGFYLTDVRKWIPMPNNDIVKNDKGSINKIPIEFVFPYLLRDLHDARDKIKALENELNETKDMANSYAQDNLVKSNYIEKLTRKIDDIRLSYASLMDKESNLKQRIKELLK